MPCAHRGRRRHPARAVRQLERRAHEDRLSPRPRAALRPHHAGDLRRAFQLLVPADRSGRRTRPCSESRDARPGSSSRRATSTCCATTAATAGSCCICSASRRWCASRSCAGAMSSLPGLDAGTVYEPYATSLRMSDIGYRNRNQAGLAVSVNSLEEYVRDLTRAITHAAPAVREARRQGGRRVPPAQRQHPADRERVLQLHPPEARRALRRAADQGAAARRRRIRRGARARCERVRSGRASTRTSCASSRRSSRCAC